MAPVNPPFALQALASKHPAQLFRQAISTLIGPAGGLVGSTALQVTQKGTPDMHVLIKGGTPSEGAAWVPGNVSSGVQGLYYCWNSASFELAIPASDPTNPRIETIVARVKDEQYEGASNEWALEALKGTATAGATLVNKTGAAVLTKNSLVLAYVLVPATSTSVITANIENVAGVFSVAPGRVADLSKDAILPAVLSWGGGTAAGLADGGPGDYTAVKEESTTTKQKYTYTWKTEKANASYMVLVAANANNGGGTVKVSIAKTKASFTITVESTTAGTGELSSIPFNFITISST